MEIPYEKVTEDQKRILDSAEKLLRFHIFDLFTTYMEGLLCRGDKMAKVTLHERFLWFITELRKEMQQQREVSEIEKNATEETEVNKVDEYFRNAPPVFTEDSYDKIMSDMMGEFLKSERGKKWLKERQKT